MRSGASLPSSSMVPTSVRTMCLRKLSPVIVKSSRSPSRSQAAASRVLENDSCCVSVGVNARKSCSPREDRGSRDESVVIDRAGPPERPIRLERRRPIAGQHAIAIRARACGESGVEVGGRLFDRENDDVVGQRAVQRDRRPLQGGRTVDVDARDLPGRVDARIGASCDRELVPARKRGVERLPQGRFDRALARLACPAAERRAVVFERQLELHDLTSWAVREPRRGSTTGARATLGWRRTRRKRGCVSTIQWSPVREPRSLPVA